MTTRPLARRVGCAGQCESPVRLGSKRRPPARRTTRHLLARRTKRRPPARLQRSVKQIKLARALRNAGIWGGRQLLMLKPFAKLVASQRSTPTSASSFHDGTLLPLLAESHAENFAKVLTKNRVGLQGQLTWASMCSGAEGAHFVVEAISRAWPKASTASGQGLQLKQLFACEKVAAKRQWIDRVINGPPHERAPDLICIFVEIEDMGK